MARKTNRKTSKKAATRKSKKDPKSTGRYVYGAKGKYLGTLLKSGRVGRIYN